MTYSIWETRSLIKFKKALQSDDHQKAKQIFNKINLNLIENGVLFNVIEYLSKEQHPSHWEYLKTIISKFNGRLILINILTNYEKFSKLVDYIVNHTSLVIPQYLVRYMDRFEPILSFLIFKGKYDIALKLTRQGRIAVSDKNKKGVTPLHLALFRDQVKLAKAIIEKASTSQLNTQTVRGYTPIHLMVQLYHNSLLSDDRLHLEDADLELTTLSGLTALHMAIVDGNHSVVNTLLEAGANPYNPFEPTSEFQIEREIVDPTKEYCTYPALHLAVAYGELKIVKILIKYRVPLDSRNRCGETSLHIAYKFGRLALANRLIELGANSELVDKNGRLPRELNNRDYDLKARYCSPKRAHFKHSCYTMIELKDIARAWNKKNGHYRVKLNQKLPELVDSLRQRLGPDEWCWEDMLPTRRKHGQIFLPDGKFIRHRRAGGLTTGDVNRVFKQYNGVIPNAKLITVRCEDGAYNDTDKYKLTRDNLLWKLLVPYKKIGIFFGIDIHASALFIDIPNREINYFDSANSGEPTNITILNVISMSILLTKEIYGEPWEIKYNDTVYQYYGSDCAIYAIHFLIERMKGKTFEQITRQQLRPEDIHRYRNIYFRPIC